VKLGRGGGRFEPKVEYPIAAGLGLAVADVNLDGKPDILVAIGTVSVLLGNGDGTFQPKVDVVPAIDAARVAIADLDGDHAPDLVISPTLNSDSGHVSVVLGHGDGTFGAVVDYPTGRLAQEAVIADLNHDGRPDLVVMSTHDLSHVLLNRGDGSFGAATELELVPPVGGFTVADLNRDGALDVIATQQTFPGSLGIQLGNGDGTFRPRMDFEGAGTAGAVTVADVNGDGFPDFLENSRGVQVVFGDATGLPQSLPALEVDTGQDPISMVVVDVSGDGTPDLLAPNSETAQISVQLGHGDGSFGEKPRPDLGNFFFLADFNGDGKLDAVGLDVPSDVALQLGNGDGTFQAPTDIPVAAIPKFEMPADVDHDGKLDIVTVHDDSSGGATISVLRGNGDGTFQASVDQRIPGEITDVAAADLGGDGKTDLIVTYLPFAGDLVRVLLSNGDGTFRTSADYTFDDSPTQVGAADLNGDGLADLIVVSGNDTLSVLLGNPDGTFQPRTDRAVGLPSSLFTVADVNGDGKADLLLYVEPFRNHALRVLLGAGDGTFTFKGDYTANVFARTLAVADVTGDGVPDAVLYGANASTVTVLSGDGDGAFSHRTDYGVVGVLPLAVVGDVTGDHKPDIVVSGGSILVETCPP
jgi:hypothetical protein